MAQSVAAQLPLGAYAGGLNRNSTGFKEQLHVDLNERITQFENMAQSDPENEMAHFSLGGAYAQAKRFDDAAGCYLRCTELLPTMSKAYQLAGEMLIEASQKDRAAEVLTKGYEVSAQQGDLMPKRAIASALEKLGKSIPTVENEDKTAEALEAQGAFMCRQSGRPGTQMEKPPFRGAIGAWIQANISKQTFDEWITQGTKVINELRLDLSRDEDAETYDRYMYEFLGMDDALRAELKSAS